MRAVDVPARIDSPGTSDGGTEAAALPAPLRARIVKRRDAYEALLRSLVVAAAKASGADVLDEHLQVYSIVALGTHVSAWYRPGGPLTLERITEVYTELIFRQMRLPATVMRTAPARRPARARSVAAKRAG
jgi:Tetracyclin repressor-like, C-terminal domain